MAVKSSSVTLSHFSLTFVLKFSGSSIIGSAFKACLLEARIPGNHRDVPTERLTPIRGGPPRSERPPPPSRSHWSKHVKNHQQQHDHQQQPQAAARAIAPTLAVAPSGQGAQDQHDQQNQQDNSED